jgi:flavin reductase (DIM6/NTAB) family NADH-FMN oxidoreductase RutF/rubredoxin
MINYKALSKISYGLYVVCSGNKKQGNGFISNSVVQVTSNPVQLMVCCNKNNYTAKVIAGCGNLSISVLPQTVSPEIIGTFGYKSGRNTDKFKDFKILYGIEDVPVLVTDAIATLECKVKQTVDAGTHLLYVCEVTEATLLNDLEPITYEYYHEVKKGLSPKNAPTYVEESKKQVSDPVLERHRCPVCGYIYDDAENDIPFSALDDDWVCPVCGVPKSEFEKI